jgi:hypothetical protein
MWNGGCGGGSIPFRGLRRDAPHIVWIPDRLVRSFVVVRGGSSFFELPDPFAHRAANLGQPFWTEDNESHEQEDDQLR